MGVSLSGTDRPATGIMLTLLTVPMLPYFAVPIESNYSGLLEPSVPRGTLVLILLWISVVLVPSILWAQSRVGADRGVTRSVYLALVTVHLWFLVKCSLHFLSKPF